MFCVRMDVVKFLPGSSDNSLHLILLFDTFKSKCPALCLWAFICLIWHPPRTSIFLLAGSISKPTFVVLAGTMLISSNRNVARRRRQWRHLWVYAKGYAKSKKRFRDSNQAAGIWKRKQT